MVLYIGMTWHGRLFYSAELFWKNLRRFVYYNRTILEIFFILIYAFEQIVLIWFSFRVSDILEFSYLVSIFAVLVLTTFALHKLVMESAIGFLEREIKELQKEKSALEFYVSRVREENQNLHELIAKNLYRTS